MNEENQVYEEIGTIDGIMAQIKENSDNAIRDKVETAMGEYRSARRQRQPSF